MKNKPIAGATRVLGGPGLEDLHVKDYAVKPHPLAVQSTPAMASAWEPDADELQRIKQGAPIILHVLGSEHPAVMLTVGEAKSKIIMP